MGNIATPELLIARWNEMCRDPSLQGLPYKIELNAWGKVEMGPPAGVGHGRQQTEVAMQLQQQLKDGVVITECPVLTDIGVRVPDAEAGNVGDGVERAGREQPDLDPQVACAQ